MFRLKSRRYENSVDESTNNSRQSLESESGDAENTDFSPANTPKRSGTAPSKSPQTSLVPSKQGRHRSASFGTPLLGQEPVNDRRNMNISMPATEGNSFFVIGGQGVTSPGIVDGEGSLALDLLSPNNNGDTQFAIVRAIDDDPSRTPLAHSASGIFQAPPAPAPNLGFGLPPSPPVSTNLSPTGTGFIGRLRSTTTSAFNNPNRADSRNGRSPSLTSERKSFESTPPITVTSGGTTAQPMSRSNSQTRMQSLEVPISPSLTRPRSTSAFKGPNGRSATMPASGLVAPVQLGDLYQDSVENTPPTSIHAGDNTDAESTNGYEKGFLGAPLQQVGSSLSTKSYGGGYAVASSKRNGEFHNIFKNIAEDDYLIEDYGCALQKEILIQGRIYISEHHLAFNANIFGWVTNVTLPFSEIVSIEKKMTAYVIPNAIQITTLHSRQTFASFLSRDTAYDLICNLWRMRHPVVPISATLPDHVERHPEEEELTGAQTDANKKLALKERLAKGLRKRGDTMDSDRTDSGEGSGGATNTPNKHEKSTPVQSHPVTKDNCDLLKNLKDVAMDTVFPSQPEKIYNLMFTSGFIRSFLSEDQKLLDIEINDWAPSSAGAHLLARSMSYIKPLSGPVGPKQTKCLITDENAHIDYDDYIVNITSTRTPDVPSGGSFIVKTRTALTWAKGGMCRVVVTTGVEWSKSSFLRSVIDRSCIEGQKQYHSDLEKAMRAYIAEHKSEFMVEGVASETNSIEVLMEPEEEKAVAEVVEEPSLLGSISETFDMVSDLLGLGEVSIKTMALAFVIGVLVISNLWTLSSSRSSSPFPRRFTPKSSSTPHAQAQSSNPDDIAFVVRNALDNYFTTGQTLRAVAVRNNLRDGDGEVSPEKVKMEIIDLEQLLGQLESRVKKVRKVLRELQEEENDE